MELEFADVREAMAWADAWVQQHSPTVVATDLDRFEADHSARFEADYGRAVGQFYVEYDALVALVDQVNFVDKTNWPRHRSMQFVLLAKNLKAFRSAMDRLVKGYYQDSVTLIRSIYDAFLRLLHISCFAEQPEGAVVERPPKGLPQFNATDIVQTQLRLNWLTNYSLMSIYAHANTFEVMEALRRIDAREGEPERFGLVFEDDVRLVEMVLPFLQFLLLVFLRFVIERLIGNETPPDTDQFTTAEAAAAFLTFALADNDQLYWRQTAADLDYVFDVLDTADRGGNWRAMRDQRPEGASRPRPEAT